MKTTIKNGVTIIHTGDAVGGIKPVSGHTGVVYIKKRNQYRAEIYLDQRRYQLGHFDKIEDAIAYREEAEKQKAAGTFHEWFPTLFGTVRRKPRDK